MSSLINTQVIYKQVPTGLPNPDQDFEIKKTTITLKDVVLKANEILVKTLFASVDPYMRVRMRDPSVPSYLPAFIPGQPMNGAIVAEVLRSTDSKFIQGDIVVAFGNWEEYNVLSTADAGFFGVEKIPDARSGKYPLSNLLGVLGVTGLTAYVGLHKICEPLTPGQTLYVSAAAGAVGQVVGQYGKSLGLRVVGSAGDDKKVDYLLKELKFDAAFNYKKHSSDLVGILKETCPNGIDIYFENVGGKMLDAVLVVCNSNARIAACGMISQYNRPDGHEGIFNIRTIIGKKIRIEGFHANDGPPTYPATAFQTFRKLLEEGRLLAKDHVTEGIENLPQAFVYMLNGKNFGKAVVKIADL